MTTVRPSYIINRDPFRSIRVDGSFFQTPSSRARKGKVPNEGDGVGDINNNNAIGGGLSIVAPRATDVPRISRRGRRR